MMHFSEKSENSFTVVQIIIIQYGITIRYVLQYGMMLLWSNLIKLR